MRKLFPKLLAVALVLQAGVAFADHHESGIEVADDHAQAAHGEHASEHGGGHGHHVPHFSDINWFHGLIGEKEGVEPSLLWRPVGMPVPLGALIINTLILFGLIAKFGGPAIRTGLLSRKERIAGDILAASKMKEEAEDQLAHYEGKLKEMGDELARIKKEMREQAEADRERILAEAEKQREAFRTEASRLLAQELAHARHEATLQAVTQAVQVARERIQAELTQQDHERLAGEVFPALKTYLAQRKETT